MSYCLQPTCQKPQNPDSNKFCQNCGTKLRLRERYRIVKPIGSGTFSRTFLATDEDIPSQPLCVIKQFFLGLNGISPLTASAAAKASELFRREALQLDKLGRHPQIPKLLAYFELPPYQYLVQEFIEGLSLAQELTQQGPFSEIQIRTLLEELLPVLIFIHSNQVIHRDIKPKNIIRYTTPSFSPEPEGNPDSHLYLVGFGASKALTTKPASGSGTIIGSPEYTAPEQLQGNARFASDLYSLGVTCIELLTQMSPFDLRRGDDWVWQEHLPRPVSLSLRRILDKMLQSSFQQRYPSAAAVLQEVKQNAAWVGKCVQRLTGHTGPVKAVVISSDSQWLASGSEDHTLKLWNLGTGELWQTLGGWFLGHSGWVNALALSPDSRVLASGSSDQTIKIWDLGTRKLVRTLGNWLINDWGVVNAVAISYDAEILVSGHGNKTIQVWELNSGKHLYTLVGHSAAIEALAILGMPTAQKLLVSGSGDRTIRIWQLADGQERLILRGHTDTVGAIALSPDGQMVASGSRDQTIRLWQLGTGELLSTFKHSDWINTVAFSPDGQILVAGSRDGVIYGWNPYTGEPLGEGGWSQGAAVNTLAFTGEGQGLAAGCADGTIKVWRLSR